MADPRTTAHFGQKIWRLGHTFHAARDHHLTLAQGQLVITHHGGFHARAAHFVDRRCRDIFTQPCGKPRLPSWRLALPTRQNTTHQQLIHIMGRNITGSQSRCDRDTAQLARRHIGQSPLHPPHRRAGRSYDIHIFHDRPL